MAGMRLFTLAVVAIAAGTALTLSGCDRLQAITGQAIDPPGGG